MRLNVLSLLMYKDLETENQNEDAIYDNPNVFNQCLPNLRSFRKYAIFLFLLDPAFISVNN